LALIIPAAGLGTRMQPVSRTLPKEMLPLGGRPAIYYALQEGLAAAVSHFVIIVSPGKEAVREYCEQELERAAAAGHAMRVTFLYQKEPRGEMDAISLARETVAGCPVAVIYPDNIHVPAPGALPLLLPLFVRMGLDLVGLAAVTEGAAMSDAGRVDTLSLATTCCHIRRFLPKGPGRFKPRFPGELRATGISVFGPHLFSFIERAREQVATGEFIDLPVHNLIVRERGMLGCRLPGTVFDIGNPEGYEQCRAALAGKTAGS